MSRDLLLDINNELVIDADGDLTLVEGIEQTAQAIATELETPVGVHSIDTVFGVPFFELIFTKNPDLGAIHTVLRGKVQNHPDIVNIIRFELDLNRQTRTLEVIFEAQSSEGLIAAELEL